MYVAEDYLIYRLLPSGATSVFAGRGVPGPYQENVAAKDAYFSGITGLAADSGGNLSVAEAGRHRIRRIAAASGVTTLAVGTGQSGFSGDGGRATEAQINAPHGLTFDNSGNLIFIDLGNRRVRKVSVTGMISTVAGTGNYGNSPDGIPAVRADLALPYGGGLTVDQQGNIYVAEAKKVRSINAGSQLITTVAGVGETGGSLQGWGFSPIGKVRTHRGNSSR